MLAEAASVGGFAQPLLPVASSHFTEGLFDLELGAAITLHVV